MKLLSLCLVLIAACGGGVASTTATAPLLIATTVTMTTTVPPTTTTTVPPTTTTTIDEIAAAADHYVEIVRPGNCAVYDWDQKWSELADQDGFLYEDDWPRVESELLPIMAEAAEADVQFINDLVAYDWPEVVEADVEGLIKEVSEDASWADFFPKCRVGVSSWSTPMSHHAFGRRDQSQARFGIERRHGPRAV